MRPISLTLKNFAGIHSGKGKDEVTIDLTEIVQEDAQIVALAGLNGAGKTTIMDNLHPYRLMPSRASSASPGGFSFYEHIVGGEGCKDLVWEHEGTRYQSVLRFRVTPKTKKTEAYLFIVDGEGSTRPWQDHASGAQSDGKTDTYDLAVEHILGKPEVFFQAQFSAQGKAPIGSMTAGEVKRLMAEMIGASRAAELSQKAADVLRLLRPHHTAAQAELTRKLESAPKEHDLEVGRADAQTRYTKTEALLRDLRETAIAIVSKIAAAQNSQEQRAAVEAQHRSHQEQVAQAVDSVTNRRAANQQEKLAALRAAEANTEQANRAVTAATALATQSAGEVGRLEIVVATERTVIQAQESVNAIEAQIAAKLAEREALTPKLLMLETVMQQLQAVREALTGQAKDGEHLATALQAARTTAELLDHVPCKGTDLNGRCQLLAASNAAASEVPEIVVKLQTARAVYKKDQDRGVELRLQLDDLQNANAAAKACDSALEDLRGQLLVATSIARSADQVRAAKSDLVEAHQRSITAQSMKSQAEQALAIAKAAADEVVGEFEKRSRAIELDHSERMLVLQRQSATLPPLDASTDVSALFTQQTQIATAISNAEAALVNVQRDLADIDANYSTLAEIRKQIEQCQSRIDAISDEMSKWLLLAKALGTDGIVAMSIEDAGPAIAAIANDLLEECYGGRFALSLLTQAETQSGVSKETFRIMVEDNHRGESKLLDLMSGGEKVWINECLVRAVALYMAQSSNMRSDTLFSDEADGPLDPKRKRQFMAMKRAVLRRGGYKREYVVTQTPELLEMCDAVIDVADL